MTSHENSSANQSRGSAYSNIESLAGVYHPHAIEVQDFLHYSNIIDLRSQSDFERDHIPGAVRVHGMVPGLPESDVEEDDAAWKKSFLSALSAVVQISQLRDPLLIYCGDAGRVSRRAAGVVRSLGLAVDVLPGGWINYRRWVQAGLELLPRLITFRVVVSSQGNGSGNFLQALREAKRQVLDLESMTAGLTDQRETSVSRQPPQAWFETQLLHELRGFDPRLPVWTQDFRLRHGGLSLPGALGGALAIAPTARMQIGAPEALQTGAGESHDAAESAARPTRGNDDATSPDTFVSGTTSRPGHRTLLPPLRVSSLEPEALAAALTVWLPTVEPRFTSA